MQVASSFISLPIPWWVQSMSLSQPSQCQVGREELALLCFEIYLMLLKCCLLMFCFVLFVLSFSMSVFLLLCPSTAEDNYLSYRALLVFLILHSSLSHNFFFLNNSFLSKTKSQSQSYHVPNSAWITFSSILRQWVKTASTFRAEKIYSVCGEPGLVWPSLLSSMPYLLGHIACLQQQHKYTSTALPLC